MNKPSKNLPKLFLRPDWLSSSANIAWISIGLSLIGLNAGVASATSSDQENATHTDDVGVLLPEQEFENTLSFSEAVYLTAFQIPSDDEESFLAIASPNSDFQPAVAEPTESNSDHRSSQVAIAHTETGNDAVFNLGAVSSKEPIESSGYRGDGSVDVHEATGSLDNASNEFRVAVVPNSPTYQSTDSFDFRSPVSIESPHPGAIAPSLTADPFQTSGSLFLASDGASNEMFHAIAPIYSTETHVSAPFSHLHPSLPMASLEPPSSAARHASSTVLVPVPSLPPEGRGQAGVDALPLPPSLPSLSSDWATSQAWVHGPFGIGGNSSNLLIEASTIAPYPTAPAIHAGTVIARPPQLVAPQFAGHHTLPYSLQTNVQRSNLQQPGLQRTDLTQTQALALPIARQWEPPTPISTGVPIAIAPRSSAPPAAFNPAAPFRTAAAPQAVSLNQFAAPNPWNARGQAFTTAPIPVPQAISHSQQNTVQAPRTYNPGAPYQSAVIPLEISNPISAPSTFALPAPLVPRVPEAPPSSYRANDLMAQVPSTVPTLGPDRGFNPSLSTPLPSTQVPITQVPPRQVPSTSPFINEQQEVLSGRSPITDSTLQLQGAGILLDDEFSARARLTGAYYLTPQILVGTALDVTEGESFSDSETEGFNINELYLAAALRDLPNLRFVIGQLDLTSYFDRNSFAKDSLTHFFDPTFQTNPALAANAIGSRPGVLVNFSPTDSIDARVAAFSSDRSIADFDLDGFAGELGFQVGNLILRGTYVSARDGGTNDGPPEIFSFDRGDGDFGIESDDREESFGFNAEYFVPEVNIGFFGRYGRYENLDAEFSGETFSGGFNVLDVFTPNDRLGLAYGRALSSDEEREGDNPDVLELFYDVPLLSNPSTRLGVTLQQRNEFSETVAGIRFRTNFDILR